MQHLNQPTAEKKPVVVQKYGGSSVADFDRLKLVAQRVVATVQKGYRVVVVVSAMGRTTDELIALARSAAKNPSRREMDMLLSAGERIASALLAMTIEELGQSAISFTGSQCGIITSHRHTEARVLEVRPYRVIDELDEGRVVIIAGYQGVSYKREVTTLGRGGTDTTAVAMAAALGADHCEICSDVDGVYSGDPGQIDNPQHLDHLSYEEMGELSRFGAKVLNEQAVELARRSGIAIYARASAGSDKMTRIGATPSEQAVVGVTAMRDLVMVRGDGGAPQLSAIGEVLEAEGVAPLWARLDTGQPALLLARSRCHNYPRLRQRLELSAARSAKLTFEERLEAATLVGHRLDEEPGFLTKLLELLNHNGLPVHSVDVGAHRLTIVLHQGQADAVQRLLHDTFVINNGAVRSDPL